jgi:hypothetical protein
MGLCRKSVAATQFAAYMACANLAMVLGARATGPLRDAFAFWQLYAGLGLVQALGAVGLALVDVAGHERRLRELDQPLSSGGEPELRRVRPRTHDCASRTRSPRRSLFSRERR